MTDGVPRPLLLHEFHVTGHLAQKTKIDRLLLSTKPRLASASRIARAALRAEVVREEPTKFLFHRNIELAHQTRIAYFVRYWQSHRFAKEIEAELRAEFRLRTPLKGKNLEVANRIRSARMPVSVHLRRGDYATAFRSGVLLPLDYYGRAVRQMAAAEQDCTFFVFSDDKRFANEWAGGRPNFVVVDHNHSEHLAHEDMRLMSLCRHNIIANSSFSRWGAWHYQSPDKRVIAPAHWLGHETDKTDLLPRNWQTMAC